MGFGGGSISLELCPEADISKLSLLMKYARKYNTPEYRAKYNGIYGSWSALKRRCNGKNSKQFKDYGGRGITYDESWKNFENFKRDMGDTYRKGLTLDRIDNNGNYCKENCRWATRKEQNENKRNNIVLKYKGELRKIIEWSKILNIPYRILRDRYYKRWAVERMLETPKLTTWSRR